MANEGRDALVPPGAVVVGFEDSPVAGRALDWAADEAVRQARPLAVVHATGALGTPGTTWLDPADPGSERALGELRSQGRAVLAGALARVGRRHPALGVLPVVALVDPTPELVGLSRTAYLVVVGSRGHGVARAVPSGQVGTWLARRAHCPVVVVPGFDPAVVRQGVLAGVPASPDARTVLDFAADHAAAHDLPLRVVQAARGTHGTSEERERWLAEAVAGLAERFPDLPVAALPLPGRPVATLVRMADRMDLLVVGQHRAPGPRRGPLFHVRSSIVDRSPCPTAVVPLTVVEPA